MCCRRSIRAGHAKGSRPKGMDCGCFATRSFILRRLYPRRSPAAVRCWISFMFTRAETDWCCRLVDLAREEDLEPAGDLTSLAVIPAGLNGQADFVARAEGVLAGLPAAAIALAAIDCRLQFQPFIE